MQSCSHLLASGHTYEELTGEKFEKESKDFLAYNGMVRLSPGRWYLPISFPKYADRFYNFEFRPTDVLIMTYPKSGTTWAQELIWTMRNNPDLDNPTAALVPTSRVPFIEMEILRDNVNTPQLNEEHPYFRRFLDICPGRDPKDGLMLQISEMTPDPRTFKTHLPFSLYQSDMLEKAKVVYLVRNPKDTVVSYLHHHRLIRNHSYVGSTDQFVQYFLDDELMFSPYWDHIREAWAKRDHPNMHLMYFEDLKKDTENEVRRLANFVGVKLTDQQLQNVIRQSCFDNMKNSAAVNSADEGAAKGMKLTYIPKVLETDGSFYRKGEVGSWKEYLSSENENKIDEWTRQNTADFGPTFPYSKS